MLTSACLLGVLALGPNEEAAAGPPPELTREQGAAAPEARRGVRWWDTPMGHPSRFSAGAHVESQLVGLSFGLRPELLYRPFRATRGFNLRVGVGLLGGPEFFYLPVDVGWRQHFVPHRILTLELGAGYEQQSFFVPQLGAITRAAFYAEGGVAFRVISRGWLGVQATGSYAPFARPGPGLGLRLGFRWNFGR